MAQKVQVLLVDDLDGGTAEETVSFGLDGVSYEIDLTTEHAAELRELLARWTGHARRLGGRSGGAGRSRGGNAARRTGSGATDIREWAKEHGYHVSERGRISAEVKAAYEAAH